MLFTPDPIICSQESPVDPGMGESHSWVLWTSAEVTPMTEPRSPPSAPGPSIGEGQSAGCQHPLTEVLETENPRGSISLILPCTLGR